jgi:2-polyprenyl-6-hydroxyphenyl methylase/3-demethylubiquinone-9 3-methyltransferase
MARNAGLVPQTFRGMSYNPFTKRYALNDDTGVNYLLHCIKPA